MRSRGLKRRERCFTKTSLAVRSAARSLRTTPSSFLPTKARVTSHRSRTRLGIARTAPLQRFTARRNGRETFHRVRPYTISLILNRRTRPVAQATLVHSDLTQSHLLWAVSPPELRGARPSPRG